MLAAYHCAERCDDVITVMRKNPLSLELQTLTHTERQGNPSSGTFPFKTYYVFATQCEWVEKTTKITDKNKRKTSRTTMLVVQGLEK